MSEAESLKLDSLALNDAGASLTATDQDAKAGQTTKG